METEEPGHRPNADDKPAQDDETSTWAIIKLYSIYFALYISGILTFLIMIADPFTMSTYFSDNSLLPGLVNREFSLVTEAEYYLKNFERLTGTNKKYDFHVTLASQPNLAKYIKTELASFGLEIYQQDFSYTDYDNRQYNGTNLYSIIRGERSTSSEAIVLCAPFTKSSTQNTMSSVALSLAMAKYFSTKSYWAKDVVVLIVDREDQGLSAWLDSYYDVKLGTDFKRMNNAKERIYYDSLDDSSGPIQAAIVLNLNGRRFSRVNIKIQGMYGQLPNLDLFNLVIEMAARESVTPYFHNKSLPFGITSDLELYMHHLETAISFIKNQATMQTDGLHGLFLRYAIQSLTIEAPEHDRSDRDVILSSLLNVGRMVEGVFRSLNNLTERFNRSYYFYIILSLRRFTSIGYYMIAFGLTVAPILLKAYVIYLRQMKRDKFIGLRAIILLTAALVMSLLSTFNISSAMISAVALVPVLLLVL